jgi:hypothetical protein
MGGELLGFFLQNLSGQKVIFKKLLLRVIEKTGLLKK